MLLVSFVEIVPFVEYGLYMAAAMQVGFTATLFMHGERDEPIQIVSHGMVRLLHFSNKKVCAGKQPTNRNICKHVGPSHVVWNIYVENLINIIQCIVFLWGSVFYTLTVFSDFLFHQKSKRCWVCKDAIFFFSPMQPVVSFEIWWPRRPFHSNHTGERVAEVASLWPWWISWCQCQDYFCFWMFLHCRVSFDVFLQDM